MLKGFHQRFVVACLSVTTLLGGCATAKQSGEIKLDRRTERIPWRLTVSGAITFKVQRSDVLINVVKLTDPRVGNMRYFGLEPADWVPADLRGGRVKASVNIVGFTGQGTYQIPATQGGEGPREPPAAANALSNARLDYVIGLRSETYQAFAFVEEPCAVAVRGSGAAGEVRCPRLSNGTDVVSMVMSWG